MTPSTELSRYFCAGIGPLQLGVVLVIIIIIITIIIIIISCLYQAVGIADVPG